MLKNLLAGNVPKNIRILAAAGMVPLPAGDMLLALVHLVRDPDPEVAAKAATTLADTPEQDIVAQVELPDCNPELIEYFAISPSAAIREAIILNPNAAGAAIAAMSQTLSAPLLELVLYNRTRILGAPEILDSIKRNPAATAQILGQVAEIESEFFGAKKQEYTAIPGQEPEPEQAPYPELISEFVPDDLILEGLPVDPQEREGAILSRIGSLTMRQKIHLGLMGTREIRAVLIRDVNKEVARAVLQSPMLTPAEVEVFAAMRGVSEEVLRQISASKAWTKSYVLIHNLVKNPKTPAQVSQRLMLRLLTKDLTLITRSRELSEAVRRNADRVIRQRSGK